MFPENWEAVSTFLAVQTQWIVAPSGHLIGLNYLALEFIFKLYGKKERRKLFGEIREIEFGALEAIRRQREKNGT